LELVKETWDVTLDAVGKIKVTGDEYATAQDVANEARLFLNDAYFRAAQGIPHFGVELGEKFSESIILRAYLLRAAARVADVNEVLSVDVEDFDPVTRQLSGAITFSTVEGVRRETVTTYF
jgi:hypothetical protein